MSIFINSKMSGLGNGRKPTRKITAVAPEQRTTATARLPIRMREERQRTSGRIVRGSSPGLASSSEMHTEFSEMHTELAADIQRPESFRRSEGKR